jgi:5'-3' exoribonuclease 2
MLLRGVRFPPATLGQADISATRQRAARTGRSYGGAPLPADSGHDNRYGRGRADYSPNNAGNSYAPYPMPPDPNQRWYGTPPQPQAPEWPPRQPQFPSAQAYNNGFSYGYGPPGVGSSYAVPPSIGRPYVPYGGQPAQDNSGGRFQHSAPPLPPPPPPSGYGRKPEGWRYPPPDNRHRRY